MLLLIILLLCGSSFAAANGALVRDIKACISFDKVHLSHLNIGWDGSSTKVKIVYKTNGTDETTVDPNYSQAKEKEIIGLIINNASIGSNLTVRVVPTENKGNQSDPITMAVNYINDVKWTRLSKNHIQFNCTLACRSAVNGCVVEINATMNRSTDVVKSPFNTWAVVDFYSLDDNQAFSYRVYAQDNKGNILGERIHGNIQPLSTVVQNAINLTTKSEEASTVFTLATSSLHVTTTSSLFTQGNILSSTTTAVVHTKGTSIAAVDKDENSSSTGLMIGVIITSLLVILLASILLGVALVLWRQRRGKTSEVSSKHITEAMPDVHNVSSSNGKGQSINKDKNLITVNAYEEIVEIPVYSKPLSTSNPMFLQTGRVKHSSVSSKKSISSQKSFENLQGNLSPVFDEKNDNRYSEHVSSTSEPSDHSSNQNTADHHSGLNKFNSEAEISRQKSPVSTEDDNNEKENPYFELINLATTNYYENTTIFPMNKQTNKTKEQSIENRDLEKLCSKCQSLPVQGLRSSKSLPLDETRRSLNDYDEPIKVDQITDPTTGHTYTLPILRKKE